MKRRRINNLWSEKQIEFVIRGLSEIEIAALAKGSSDLSTTVLDLIQKGQNYADIDNQLEERFDGIEKRFALTFDDDLLSIDAFICFQVAFEREIQFRHERRELIKVGSVVLASHLFRNREPISISENDVREQLSDAYAKRLRCDFAACHRSLDDLERTLAPLSHAWAKHLLAEVIDLRVEALHTACRLPLHHLAVHVSTKSLNLWFEIKEYERLLHAFMREAILYRQLYYSDFDRDHFYAVARTLQDAENYEIVRLADASQSNKHVQESIGKFYTDEVKGLAQIGDFENAKKYIQLAEARCADAGGEISSVWLFLIRSKAVYIAEKLATRPYPRDFIELDETIGQMKIATATAVQNYPDDLVLHQVLRRDTVPLLALTHTAPLRDEARELFDKCRTDARSLGLDHELRVLNDTSRRFLKRE